MLTTVFDIEMNRTYKDIMAASVPWVTKYYIQRPNLPNFYISQVRLELLTLFMSPEDTRY